MKQTLTYTDEMEEQDRLWLTEDEDINTMEKLYNKIIEEAKTKGFKGIINMYDGDSEKLIEVYESEMEKDLATRGKVEIDIFGRCQPLIEKLESILNK